MDITRTIYLDHQTVWVIRRDYLPRILLLLNNWIYFFSYFRCNRENIVLDCDLVPAEHRWPDTENCVANLWDNNCNSQVQLPPITHYSSIQQLHVFRTTKSKIIPLQRSPYFALLFSFWTTVDLLTLSILEIKKTCILITSLEGTLRTYLLFLVSAANYIFLDKRALIFEPHVNKASGLCLNEIKFSLCFLSGMDFCNLIGSKKLQWCVLFLPTLNSVWEWSCSR